MLKVIRAALRTSLSHFAPNAALPLIVAAAYFTVAMTPCPPNPVSGADAPHTDHAVESAPVAVDDSTSLVAPCPCGCDPHKSGLGSGKREPGLAFAMPAMPLLTRPFGDETPSRLADAPVFMDSPIPIAA
jgi:hypothetical protein